MSVKAAPEVNPLVLTFVQYQQAGVVGVAGWMEATANSELGDEVVVAPLEPLLPGEEEPVLTTHTSPTGNCG